MRLSAIVLLALLLFACSEGETSSTEALSPAVEASTPTTLQRTTTAAVASGPTKSDYIEQANAICIRSQAQTFLIQEEVLAQVSEDPTREEAIESYIEVQTRMLPVVEAMWEDLKALPSPAGDEGQLAEIWSDGDEFIAIGRQIIEDASAGDQDAIARLINEDDPEDELMNSINNRVFAYGITECGGPTETAVNLAARNRGDDPTLDQMWDECESGDYGYCDLLSFTALGSEYQVFGATCGDRGPIQDDFCLATHGNGPAIDSWREQCRAGDTAGCDLLFQFSEPGSEDERLAKTCGGRTEESEFIGSCIIRFGL